MSKTTAKKELAVKPDQALLDAISSNMPVEEGFTRKQFPRINFISKDVTEEKKVGGKKQIDVIIEAGTFIREVYNPETKEFEKTELGKTVDVNIFFRRKQLRFYDEKTNSYTSSPEYDEDDEVVTLFNNKAKVDRGTPADLKQRAKYTKIEDGKKRSKLEEQKILYVIYEGEIHQLTVRGSSSWNFSKYAKSVNTPTVITTIDSEEETSGSNTYNKMTFEVARDITADEAQNVLTYQTEIKEAIEAEKAYFSKFNVADEDGEESSIDDEDWSPDAPKVEGKGMDLKQLGGKQPDF